MKIVCPVDFSTVSDYAFEAACRLAKQLDADLCLFHATVLSGHWSLRPETQRYFDALHAAAVQDATAAMQPRLATAAAEGVRVRHHIAQGDFMPTLTQFVADEQSDLVVMGSTGAGGNRAWYVGSNTQKAVRSLHRNVLVVKGPLAADPFRSAVFASGLLTEDHVAFRRFLAFADLLGVGEIHILTIQTDGLFSPPRIVYEEAQKDFRALAEGHAVQTHFYENISVEAGIRHFTTEAQVDLVALSNLPRHPLVRIFSGSTVEMLVNHADVPVLAVDGEL